MVNCSIDELLNCFKGFRKIFNKRNALNNYLIVHEEKKQDIIFLKLCEDGFEV